MKKSFVLILTLTVITVVLSACAQRNNAPVQRITPKEAKVRLDVGEEVTFVDVRTQEEYEQGHIENAVLLPVDNISAYAPTVIPDTQAVYFVYCRTGNRSATASAQLVAMSYTNIFDLGDITLWPYEIVTGP